MYRIILTLLLTFPLHAAHETFDDMPVGDWLSADGTRSEAPSSWNIDTTDDSFGHPEYSGYIRVLEGGVLEAGGTDHSNALWRWEPSMPFATGVVTFSVRFSLHGKLPAETNAGNRAVFFIGNNRYGRGTVFLEFRRRGDSELCYNSPELERQIANVPGLLTDGSWNALEVELDYNSGTSRARLNDGEWVGVDGITRPEHFDAIGLCTNGIVRYDFFKLKPDGPKKTFVKKTTEFGLAGWRPSVRVAWADIDRDGWIDFSLGGGQVWRGVDGTRFERVDGIEGALWSDIDNDGRIDLYDGRGFYRNLDGSRFEYSDKVPDYEDSNYMGIALGDWDGDGFIDVYCGSFGGTSRVYRNEGGPSTTSAGSGQAGSGQGRKFTTVWEQYAGKTYGVAVCDFDSDSDMDIYVSNYWLMANVLWVNDSSGGDGGHSEKPFPFANLAAEYGVAGDPGVGQGYGHTMGAGWGDFDNDGYFDLAAMNLNHHDGRRGEDSKFYRNLGAEGDYHFTDKSEEVRLAWQESMSQPVMGDYDNDGYLDFFVNVVYGGDHPVLYHNNGSKPEQWNFSDVTDAVGLNMPHCYIGGFCDIDNDGDLDLIADADLWINEGNDNHWLGIRLIANGSTVNKAALGCQVRIDVPGLGTLARQVCGGRGNYTHQDDPRLHFGLGTHTGPVTAEVRWLDGTIQKVTSEIDCYITITQE
jgi:hypothetical protein